MLKKAWNELWKLKEQTFNFHQFSNSYSPTSTSKSAILFPRNLNREMYFHYLQPPLPKDTRAFCICRPTEPLIETEACWVRYLQFGAAHCHSICSAVGVKRGNPAGYLSQSWHSCQFFIHRLPVTLSASRSSICDVSLAKPVDTRLEDCSKVHHLDSDRTRCG